MERHIQTALKTLQDGNPIGLPTETVYGLAANAFDDHAVSRIFALKKRPSFNPLITHVASFEQAETIGIFSDLAKKLVKAFWPGPLAIIVPKKPDTTLSSVVTAGLPTVAIRYPAHPIAQQILSRLDFPLAAPSANISETVSPTTAQHVIDAFPDLPVLDGGPCEAGLESTIIDITTAQPTILRPGSITKEAIESALGVTVKFHSSQYKSDDAIKAPGQMLRHYAPSIPVRLNVETVKAGEALITFGDNPLKGKTTKNLAPSGDLEEAAANLFAFLRELDSPSYTGIAVTPIPNHGIGIAINDRLVRASRK